MSGRSNETAMGGAKGSFETTRWTQIQKAKILDQERRQASVNNLLQRYWKPVYCCVIRKGYSNEDAKDITQNFFCEIVLGRDLIQQADQAKGRFRTFLLTALNRYVTSLYRKETAQKRRPLEGLVQLEHLEASSMQLGDSSELCPEQAFHYTWATTLLDEVIAEVKNQCFSKGEATYWEVFRATVLAPNLYNTKAPFMAELCAKYSIESEKKASNMAQTVKKRWRKAFWNHVRRHVGSDSEVEDEIRDLIEILSKGGAA